MRSALFAACLIAASIYDKHSVGSIYMTNSYQMLVYNDSYMIQV